MRLAMKGSGARWQRAILSGLVLCGVASPARADDVRTLRGVVLRRQPPNDPTPAVGVKISLLNGTATDVTKSGGIFMLRLPSGIAAGTPIEVRIDDPKHWLLIDGRTLVPDAKVTEPIKLFLLPKSSPEFLTRDQLRQAVTDALIESGRQRIDNTPGAPTPFQRSIQEWAQARGLGIEQVQTELDKWADAVLKNAGDLRERALAEAVKENMMGAARLFTDAADMEEARFEAIERAEKNLAAQKVTVVADIVADRIRAGSSYYNALAFDKALAAFEQALKHVTRTTDPTKWAEIQIWIGVANHDLGTRSDGIEGGRHLVAAAEAYQNALKVYTREQLPQDWAATQNNLGNALSQRGIRTGGEAGAHLLGQAVEAYQNALKVRTREQLPQQWAMTQNNLGTALKEQGIRTGGEAGAHLLGQAVEAYQNALKILTREQSPQLWAGTQNNLGNVLKNHALVGPAADRQRLLDEAIAALRNAWTVYTPEHNLPYWMKTGKNLLETQLLAGDFVGASTTLGAFASLAPDNAGIFGARRLILHDKLFDYPGAFALDQSWLARHLDDRDAQMNWTEAHITTARFTEATKRLADHLLTPDLPPTTVTALRILEMIALLGDAHPADARAHLAPLRAAIAAQPTDFTIQRSFDGTRHFIETDVRLAPHRAFLLALLDAAGKPDRDAILGALDALDPSKSAPIPARSAVP